MAETLSELRDRMGRTDGASCELVCLMVETIMRLCDEVAALKIREKGRDNG